MNGLNLLFNFIIDRDPWELFKIEHKLTNILFFTMIPWIWSLISWNKMDDFSVGNIQWLQRFISLKSAIPLHHTIGRFLQQLTRCILRRRLYS